MYQYFIQNDYRPNKNPFTRARICPSLIVVLRSFLISYRYCEVAELRFSKLTGQNLNRSHIIHRHERDLSLSARIISVESVESV